MKRLPFKALFQRDFSSSYNKRLEDLKLIFSPHNQTNQQRADYLSRNARLLTIKRASLLVPISYRRDGTSIFTLSKRVDEIRSFSGQVSFMGGNRDTSDLNDVEVAYREAREEAGIEQDRLTFLAELSPILMSNNLNTGVLVTPVVVHFDKETFVPKLNRQENEYLFEVPTEFFLSSQNHEVNIFQIKDLEASLHYFKNPPVINGTTHSIESIWGINALICIVVSSILNSKVPQFQVDPRYDFHPSKASNFFEYLTNKYLDILLLMNTNRRPKKK